MPNKLPDDKSLIEQAAIASCVKYLISTPDICSSFIMDVKKSRHKQWHLYKTFYSEHRSQTFKGRTEPARKKHSGVPVHKTEQLAKAYDRTKQTFIPSLHLGYAPDKKTRIQKILKSDCPPQIKAELLEANL